MQSFEIFIISILIGLFLFLIRYFNKIINLITEISIILNKISKQNPTGKINYNEENYWQCPECLTDNSNSTFQCKKCGYRLK